MNPGKVSTDQILNEFTKIYKESYKSVFEEYGVELEFTTVLTYYSGMCSVVVKISSLPGLSTAVEMCLMIDHEYEELCKLDKSTIARIIKDKILSRHTRLLMTCREVGSMHYKRKVIIKNINYKDSLISLKAEKDLLIVELNDTLIADINRSSNDFINTLISISNNYNISPL
ncbi:MAG: hypothetical protein ACOZCL_10950 [Bacillota bacterium]